MNIHIFNTAVFLETAGYFGLFAIICAETSVFIGFLLPGDTLLFTAGFLSSLGYFNIRIIIAVAFVAAVIGDNIGYAVGKKFGVKIFRSENSRFFDREHIGRAERFYERHGGKTLVVARFLPVIRTAAPVLAGVGKMRYWVFFFYNLSGAVIWTVGMTLLGYYLGRLVPHADRYITLFVAAVLALSLAPGAYALLRDKGRRQKFKDFFKRRLRP